MDASRDFIYFLRTSSVGDGGGGVCYQAFLLFSFPCSADHNRDWPPCKVVFSGWQPNGKSLSWMGLTRERWCCTRGLVSRLDMNTCQTSIKTDILL